MAPRVVADGMVMLRPPSFRPTVPVLIGKAGLVPIVALAAMFTIFGVQVGLPVALSAIFGGVGGTVSLLFHEFGHVRAAGKLTSVRPMSVSLVWGGAATTLDGRYMRGVEQTRVAIGGPAASFTFAFSLIAVCLLPSPLSVKEPLLLLAAFNVMIGLLNLFPAYPLDGYKVATGLLWSLTGCESRSRRILRRIGIGWAALEFPAALMLVAEKPRLGGFVIIVAATLIAQKRYVHRLKRSQPAES